MSLTAVARYLGKTIYSRTVFIEGDAHITSDWHPPCTSVYHQNFTCHNIF